MSVRTEPRDLSQQMQQALTIPADQMLAAASQSAAATGTAMVAAPQPEAQAMNEQHLAEANHFNTNSPDHPLHRTVCINIRASLSDLCLKSQAATWSPPSAEATKAIFQQARPEPATRTARSPPTAPRQPRQRQQRRRRRLRPLTPHTLSLQPATPSRTLRRPSVRGRRAQKKFLDLSGSAENQGA